jgi:hypothetical protein
MSDVDPRAYVHPETGEVFMPKEDLENAERELRRLRARIRAYERKEEDIRKEDPNRDLILALIERWKLVTGHPRSNVNANDRFDLIRSRLREGYTPQQVEMAIDGIGAYPYVVGPGERAREGEPKQRHDRLGICLGCGEKLEHFAVLGWEARRNGGIPNLNRSSASGWSRPASSA